MIDQMLKLLTKFAIRKALEKPAPPEIPHGTRDGRDNDYILIELLNNDPQPFRILVSSIHAGHVEGRHWENKVYGDTCCVRLDQALELRIKFTHFFKGLIISYNGTWDYLKGLSTLLHWRAYASERLRQYRYERRVHFRQSRIDILRELVAQSLEKGNDYLREPPDLGSSTNIFFRVYGERAANHKMVDAELLRFSLILSSLVNSGDLRKTQYGYIVEGQALTTLALHEEEELRHRDNRTNNRILVYLTVVLVFHA